MPVIVTDIPSKGYITTTAGRPGSITSSDISIGSYHFEKVWGVTPGYRAKMEKHALPMNAYTIFRKETWYGQGKFVSTPLTGGTPADVFTTVGIPTGNISSGDPFPSEPSPAQMAVLIARSHQALLTKLKNQKVNLAQAYAERRRTADLINKTIQRFVLAFRLLREKRLGEALRVLGAPPPSRRRLARINAIWYGRKGRKGSGASKNEFENAAAVWLEIQYGWRPLLNDIWQSAQEIEKATDQSPRKTKATASSQIQSNTTVNVVVPSTNRVDVQQKDVTSASFTTTVWYTTPDLPRTLSQLGFTNPAYLAWELTPFSFVVDWFLPIGNAINAIDATLGLSFNKGCDSIKINSFRRSTGTGRTNATHRTTGSATCSGQLIKFVRQPILSFPTVNFPSFKNPLGVEHAANGIALLIQVFSGRSR